MYPLRFMCKTVSCRRDHDETFCIFRGINRAKVRKKDSVKLVWDTEPRRAPNPKDIEFKISEIVLSKPKILRVNIRFHLEILYWVKIP